MQVRVRLELIKCKLECSLLKSVTELQDQKLADLHNQVLNLHSVIPSS